LKDRFLNGCIAGSLSGLVASLFDYLFVSYFKFGTIHLIDFAGVFIFGSRPQTLGEKIFAQFGVLVFTALIGILFVHLILKISSRYLLWKGLISGILLWFFVYALVELYKVPHFHRTSLASSMENTIIAMIYGFVLSALLTWLQNRERI